MVCGFCSTGSSLKIHLKDGQAINLSPTTNYPVNLGMACPKGWEALSPLQAKDRAVSPYIRDKFGQLQPTDWDTALQFFTLRFKAIQDKFGPAAIAWLGTGQICTEELAFLVLSRSLAWVSFMEMEIRASAWPRARRLTSSHLVSMPLPIPIRTSKSQMS
jgi:predicted molibdopterin-dependent oxidoreductase YjgC